MKKQVYAHLLTWFKTKEYSGSWEMWQSEYAQSPHNPEDILFDGKKDIASTSYPLTGVYDSSDPDIIEYQLMLMKLSGIDGVIVDWDGLRLNRYRHDTFMDILPFLIKYDMKLIMCYEEWSAYWPVGEFENRMKEIKQAEKDIEYLYENFASLDIYGTINGKKPILVFRKIHEKLFNADEWRELKKTIRKYDGITLFNDCYDETFFDVADGYFFWVGNFDEKTSSNTMEFYEKQYQSFYRQATADKSKVLFGSVMPGFDDTPVWGWGDGARIAPRYDGDRMEKSWENAIGDDIDCVQIVTWNDWNEGSQIEPCDNYGYKYIKLNKKYSARFKGAEDGIEDEYLTIPLEIYRLRKNKRIQNECKEDLDQIVELVFKRQFDLVKKKLEEVRRKEG